MYFQEMNLLVLDPMVINLALQYRNDFFGINEQLDNNAMRHGAYRQFILWRHGRLPQGARRVIPSCVVTRIRQLFPSATGHYVGFLPARLA